MAIFQKRKRLIVLILTNIINRFDKYTLSIYNYEVVKKGGKIYGYFY